jgi:putative transposase
MPHRKTEFANGEIYHLVLRRLDDKPLFVDTDDYYRGIFSIYEFNNANPVVIQYRRRTRLFKKRKLAKNDRGPSSIVFTDDERQKLVEVIAFALMPNHLHLLVRQLKDGGIVKFMSKVGTGYPPYFRQKHKIREKGYFFRGRFVSVHIKSDNQLIAVFVYIHTNPLSLIESGWKEGKVKNFKKAIEFLENYKWSSYQDYLGKKNFPSVTDRDFMLEAVGGEKRVRRLVEDWIRHKREIKGMVEIALE